MSRGQALRRIAPRADVELHRRAIGVPILRRIGTTLTAAVVNSIHGLIDGTAPGIDRKDRCALFGPRNLGARVSTIYTGSIRRKSRKRKRCSPRFLQGGFC